MKFSIRKKGFDPSEVDNYVAEAEQTMLSQKERIQHLKSRVALLERELEVYYEKKDLITSALAEALKRAEEIEHQASIKYNLEIQRLRQFHARWMEHYDQLLIKFPAPSANADKFNSDMDKIFIESEMNFAGGDDVVSDTFVKEKARLDNNNVAQKVEVIIDTKHNTDTKQNVDAKQNEDAKQNADEKQNADTKQNVSIRQNAPSELAVLQEEKVTKPQLTPLERIKIYLQNNDDVKAILGEKANGKDTENKVLSLDEALHPKQDLKDIMRDLGVLEE